MYQPPYQNQNPYQNTVPGLPVVSGGYPATSPVGGYPTQYTQGPGGYVNPQQLQGGGYTPPGVDPIVYQQFKAADVNNSDQLSEKELRAALVNSDYTRFDARTVTLMVKMFDTDQ
jgi:hypothetical protein